MQCLPGYYHVNHKSDTALLLIQCNDIIIISLNTEQSFNLSHVQIRQGRSMEDSGGSALGDVHFSAQSSKKLCCNRCVLKYDKMQVGAKEF